MSPTRIEQYFILFTHLSAASPYDEGEGNPIALPADKELLSLEERAPQFLVQHLKVVLLGCGVGVLAINNNFFYSKNFIYRFIFFISIGVLSINNNLLYLKNFI